MYEDRWYQTEASDALFKAIETPGCAPVIAVPTGAGKTVIMGLFITKYLKKYPDNEVLVLSHTQLIIEQDAEALENFFPDKHIAVYSAGLDRREQGQITVAGIQSAVRNPETFQWANLVIVDEVHTVNHEATGMYRTLLDSMKATLTGMSATVYRSGHGYIYKGLGTLFNTLVYDLTSIKNFNRLVDEGYLSNLIPIETETQLNSEGITKSGGDFNLKQLSEAHDRIEITRSAIKNALHYGKNYKKWLVFAIDIDHANSINDELNSAGIDSLVLHSEIQVDRNEIIDQFTKGGSRALVSVGMITTGFDAPNVDLILMLRPTASAVLHVQMLGRGLRVASGKDHCLVLDYAGNTARLGPINNVIVPKSKESKGKGEAPTKTCPQCRTITYASAKYCESCDYEYVFKTKLEKSASQEDVIQKNKSPLKKWMKVSTTQYSIHRKPGVPDSVMITYMCGLFRVRQWLCVAHPGSAGMLGQHIAARRGYEGEMTAKDLYAGRDRLRVPDKIQVDLVGKYPQVVNAQF